MIRQPRTDFFVRRDSGDFIRLASFREYAPNEMVLAFYGFVSTFPTLAFEYADRIVTREEMPALRVEYSAAKPIQRPIHHFTVHCEHRGFNNGEFHLRANYGSRPIHNVSIPAPLNSGSQVFLDFVVFPDDLSKYSTYSEETTDRDVLVATQDNQWLLFRGRFAGADFDLESIVAEEESQLGRVSFPAIVLNGGTLKGAFTWYNVSTPSGGFGNRPEGTYVLLRFKRDPASFLVKTFVFA
jgi:hypothetical protein